MEIQDLKKLKRENLIELAKLRLKNENKKFSEIEIEDDSFKYFDGVSFIVKSDELADYRYSFHFDVFYPNEFFYLQSITNVKDDKIFNVPDLRNKLGPFKNLITMIENGLMKGNIEVHDLILDEIERCKKSLSYLSGK